MSHEAWGDDDDGLDGMRETYTEQLIADGWLNDADADALQKQLKESQAELTTLREQRDKLVEATNKLVVGDGPRVDGLALIELKTLAKEIRGDSV